MTLIAKAPAPGCELERRLARCRRNCSILTDENIRLRAHIEQMEDALMAKALPATLLGLPRKQALILAYIADKGRVSKGLIHQLLYGGDPNGGPDPKIIEVLMSRIRKRLPPGDEIKTIWGEGYEMPPASIEALKRHGKAHGTD